MPAFVVPAAFQHIDETLKIRVHIGVRMIDRMAHAGLRRQMNDLGKSVSGKQLTRCVPIREIGVHETEPRIAAQYAQSRLLQDRVVVAVEAVQTYDVAALRQQPTSDVKAD